MQITEPAHPGRKGFFTDTSICIGCKACEVACKEWNRNPADSDWKLSDSSYDNTTHLGADTWRHVAFIEQEMGRKFGDAADPLLVSVRSGARASMPGMMDTILNLGLNDETVASLARKSGNERPGGKCLRQPRSPGSRNGTTGRG